MTWPNAGVASHMTAGSRHADPDVTERILRHQAEGLAAQEPTDFWGQPLPQAPADLRMPASTPGAEEPAVTRASWSAADTTSPGRGTRAPDRRPGSRRPSRRAPSQRAPSR